MSMPSPEKFAEQLGNQAAYDGKSIHDNPYDLAEYEGLHTAWKNGWCWTMSQLQAEDEFYEEEKSRVAEPIQCPKSGL